jgi:hypothetical protein
MSNPPEEQMSLVDKKTRLEVEKLRLETGVVRKNSIQLPSDRHAGTYLFSFPALGNQRNQLCWWKILLNRTDRVPS